MQLIVTRIKCDDRFEILIDIYTSLPASQIQLSKCFLHGRSLICVLRI